MCCVHVGSVVIENVLEAHPEYEEVIEEYDTEVLADGVPKALTESLTSLLT